MEEWKSINKRYSVSNKGRVRSEPIESFDNRNRRRFKAGVILKPGTRPDAYEVVNISGFRHKTNWKVHQLVAIHFLPNPNNYKSINHINGNRADNRAENLEWCTQKHNCQHAYDVLHRAPSINIGLRNGYSKPVIDVTSGVFYESCNEAAKSIGCKPSTLGAMLRGQNTNRTNLKYC